MRRLSPALLLALLTAATPASAGVTVEGGLIAGDAALAFRASASGDGADARASASGSSVLADVRTACVPDWTAACDTDVVCDESLPPSHCGATRRPRPPWGCWYTPEGWLRCREAGGNGTGAGNATGHEGDATGAAPP